MTSKNPCETIATGTDCGSPAPRTVCGNTVVSAIAAKPRVCACQSRKLGSDTLPPRLPLSPIWNSCTMRSASGYGRGRSSTPSTTVNIAAAAPMPRPIVRIAVTENDGTRARERQAMPQIAGEVAQPGAAQLVARRLARLRDAAELQAGRAQRVLRRHAGGDVLRRLLLDVEGDLFGDAVVPASHPASPQASVARSTRSMARDSRRHDSSSRTTCRRPAAVSL